MEYDISSMHQHTTQSTYQACLNFFVQGLIDQEADNVLCIVLYGGLVRDKEPIPGWSDIDLIVVFKEIAKRDVSALSRLIDDSEHRFGIRIDLTQLDQDWLTNPVLLEHLYSSEVLNALAMRPDVSLVLQGALPSVSVSPEQEKMAARFYISHTLSAIRRYLLQDVLRPSSQRDLSRHVARLTRWVFSIIRASLRLFDVYVHPYKPSLREVERLFPDVDLSVPYLLLAMRENPLTISCDGELFAAIERFIDEYSVLVFHAARCPCPLDKKGM